MNKITRKKRRKLLTAATVVTVSSLSLLIGYTIQAAQHSGKFNSGTSINGLDVSNMTAQQAEDAVRADAESYTLTLTMKDGSTASLSSDDIGLNYTPDGSVARILDSQNSYAWIAGTLGSDKSYTIAENYTYSSDRLKEAVEALPALNEANAEQPVNAHMVKNDDGTFSIADAVEGSVIDEDALLQNLGNAIEEGQTAYTLSTEDYVQPAVTADDEDLNTQVNDLNGFLQTTITYTLHDGSTLTLDGSTTTNWLSQKEDDPSYYYINTDVLKEKTEEYAAQLADKDNETYTTKTFHSTNRGDVEVESDAYGYIVDEEKEADTLYNELTGKESAARTPMYADAEAKNSSFGDTYIEVDLNAQHLYYYIDGALFYDCDFVSGTATDPDRATPTGSYQIYYRDTDRTLNGQIDPKTGKPVYSSPVSYWMAFNGNVGFHDASWRSTFGGSIYEYSGSHGCINLSYASAQKLYENSSIGTRVIVI